MSEILKIEKNLKIKKKLREYIFVTLGVIILSIGFYFFLQPVSIVTGGFLGVSIILSPAFDNIDWMTTSMFLYIANTIALIFGLIFLGKDFFLKTIYGTLLSPTVMFVLEFLPQDYFYKNISNGNEKMICLICGCLLCAVGVALAIKNNGSTGGMDVVQKIISKIFKFPMSVAMYLTDWVVVLLSGFLLIGMTSNGYTWEYHIENVVWGSIGVLVQAFIIDYICLSLKPRRTVYVITNKQEEIMELIYANLQRGITLANVTGGYSKEDKTMIICTMDKNEAYRITNEIAFKDPDAFTFVTSCKEVRGKYNKKGKI